MKRIRAGAALMAAAAMVFSAAPLLAQADQGNSQVETTVVTPQGTPRTVSGQVGGLNFANNSFSLSQNDEAIAVKASGATITYNGQDANIYRLMGSPQVSVTGTFVPTNAGGNRGVLYAKSVTITSEPTAKLERSSYTEQAQPAFSAGQLGELSTGGTSRNYGSVRHSTSVQHVNHSRTKHHPYRHRSNLP